MTNSSTLVVRRANMLREPCCLAPRLEGLARLSARYVTRTLGSGSLPRRGRTRTRLQLTPNVAPLQSARSNGRARPGREDQPDSMARNLPPAYYKTRYLIF